ncbi:hypothetical protein GJ496_011926 [Pomphorhynchus laevis]|nr:hypothetical protein GJ496_011926 [Pomphorhynchus laevis]
MYHSRTADKSPAISQFIHQTSTRLFQNNMQYRHLLNVSSKRDDRNYGSNTCGDNKCADCRDMLNTKSSIALQLDCCT